MIVVSCERGNLKVAQIQLLYKNRHYLESQSQLLEIYKCKYCAYDAFHITRNCHWQIGFLLWNAENSKQWSKEPQFNSIFVTELNLK